MSFLSAADILAVQDVPYEDVEVPEWKGTVRIKGMSAAERDAYEKEMMTREGRDYEIDPDKAYYAPRARILVRCLCDEAFTPLFSAADIDALQQKSAAVLVRLWDVARKLSGLSKEDEAELVGNSAAQADSSPSA